LLAGVLIFNLAPAVGLDLDVPYVETPPEIVKLMVDLAQVSPDDYVIDLGTGDGRIVIAAVEKGATGLGIDLDPQRVRHARENAEKSGVSGKVTFIEQDIFKADISRASVVTMFLNSEVNLRMRPLLLQQLNPGTRVVSHNFDMGEWLPDHQEQILLNSHNNFYIHDVYYWVVPANVQGRWLWDSDGTQFSMSITQQFQKIIVDITADGRALQVERAILVGSEIIVSGRSNTGSRYQFTGSINGDGISGGVEVSGNGQVINTAWSAVRRNP
jgi:predicted O-methyltransferase YrrM